MKKPLLFSLLAAAALASLFSACETQDAGGGIEVTPGYTEIHPGERVTLTASGGVNYTWSLGTAGCGGLSNSKGASVTYIAPSTLTTTVDQTIIATSSSDAGTGSSSSSTNAPVAAASGSGSATIRIIGTGVTR